MSGEYRIARGALAWCALATPLAAIVAALIRGAHGALSVAIAAGLVMGNTVVAVAISSFAGRTSKVGSAMVALPSYAIRISILAGLLALFAQQPYVDKQVFSATFVVALAGLLTLQARTMRRTPWLALTFAPKER